LLDTYTGIVQCDGYTVYKPLANSGGAEGIVLTFCWSHLRRRFVEIERSNPAPTAKEALSRIAQLYAIERALRGRLAEERRQGRQAHMKPLVAALKTWFEERLKILSSKSPAAEAIRYGLNHWDGLTRFLDDGRIEMDTNSVERIQKAVAASLTLNSVSIGDLYYELAYVRHEGADDQWREVPPGDLLVSSGN